MRVNENILHERGLIETDNDVRDKLSYVCTITIHVIRHNERNDIIMNAATASPLDSWDSHYYGPVIRFVRDYNIIICHRAAAV